MPQSLDKVLLHLVFSTKDRFPCLGASVRPALHAYLATVSRNAGCECPRAGGVADHVHLAIQFPRTMTIAALVEDPGSAQRVSRALKASGLVAGVLRADAPVSGARVVG